MPERDQLLAILRRVRRRLRSLAAAQGAVSGAAAALVTAAPVLVVARWRGDARVAALGAVGVATVAAAVLAAVAWALRPISLRRCARVLDRAAGADRVFAALAFMGEAQTAFTRAAIEDAIARARAETAAPARVAPWRRPRGSRVLSAGAVAAVAAALAPWPRHAGRARATMSVAAVAARPTEPIFAARELDAEREEARAAAEAARATGDAELKSLAQALREAIGDLARAGGDRGATLDRLAALQRRAEEAARESEALADGLRRAGAALQAAAATRPLADALATGEAAATERAAEQLGGRAEREREGASERAALARAFEQAAKEAAAAGAARPGGGADRARRDQATQDRGGEDEEPAQRRLQREGSAEDQRADGSGDSGSRERRLQRLRRDLDETANACRSNPQACAGKVRDRGQSLPRMQQEAWGGEARRRLAEAIAELRERLQRAGRDGNGQSPEQRRQKLAQRRFARAARGQPGVSDGASGAGAPEDSDSDGDGDSDSDGDSMNAEGEGGDLPSASDGEKGGAGDRGRASLAGGSGAGESAGQGAQGTSATEGVPGTGNGIGNESGGAPLSHDKEAGSPRGRERSAAVRSAAGPKRSQVIEAAAARGFAHADYRRVYQDYGAVVEETLDASAVPPGQRYLVRRYFQLIRPRAAPPARPPSGGPNP